MKTNTASQATRRLKQLAALIASFERKRIEVVAPLDERIDEFTKERTQIFEAHYPTITGLAIGDRVIGVSGRVAQVESYLLYYLPKDGLPPKEHVGVQSRAVLASGKLGKTLFTETASHITKAPVAQSTK